jgi:hypothetical protein
MNTCLFWLLETLLQKNPEAETSSLLVEYGFGKLTVVFLSATSS